MSLRSSCFGYLKRPVLLFNEYPKGEMLTLISYDSTVLRALILMRILEGTRLVWSTGTS